jgi:hypothetical protein
MKHGKHIRDGIIVHKSIRNVVLHMIPVQIGTGVQY